MADAARQRYAEALARRATAVHGEARARLEAKLAALRDRAALPAAAPAVAGRPSLLADLVEQLNDGAGPELRAVREHRATWHRLRVERQLHRSLAQVPDKPGPLNSQHLVLRTLKQLQMLSPAYLGRFIAHAEALAWLEQASQSPATPPRRKPARPKGG